MYRLTIKVRSSQGGTNKFQSHRIACLFCEILPGQKTKTNDNAHAGQSGASQKSGADQTAAPRGDQAPATNGVALESPGYRSAELEPPSDSNSTFWHATIVLPDKSTIEDHVILRLVAPDGSIIKEHHHKLMGTVDSECEIIADAKSYEPLEAPGVTSTRSKVRGRVIDVAGQTLVAGEQVAIIAADATPGSQEIVAVTRTDSQGYFSLDCPKRTFNKVFVKVANYPAETVTLKNGELPEQLIVAVAVRTDYETDGKDGCACETPVPALPDAADIISSPQAYTSDVSGGCVSFTKPSRTIEEFDFYGVVRTTEPEIVGLTLPEPNFIPADKVKGFANPRRPHMDAGTGHGASGGQGTTGGSQSGGTGGTGGAGGTTNPTKPRDPKQPKDAKSRVGGTRSDRSPMPASTITMERAVPEATGSAALNKLIDPKILKTLAKLKGGYTENVLSEAARQTEESMIESVVAKASRSAAARSELSVLNPLDWDDDPTFYQAATIAHGHILHFKQTWKANGFSLGDLLYSLPLAPGQKRQVAILDWERREVASRTESLELEEQLAANLTRDRDIQEIVSATLKEDVVGASLSLTASSASNSGSSGPGSGAASALMMVSGSASGIGGGASVGFQHGSRKASANSLQQVRDRIAQSASSLRSQRSTVVQSVAQGETLRAQTEVIANYNHCHAITVEYFEVLRHFAVEHKLVDVQECLFVPLLMSPFDRNKVIRWRQALQKGLRDRRLLPAFDALDRIVHNYDGADVPPGSYADEPISRIEGLLRVSFRLVRPADKEVTNGQSMLDPAAWAGLAALLGTSADAGAIGQIANATDKDKAFLEFLGPQIARELVERIEAVLVTKDGDLPIQLQFDLVSDFKNKTPLQIRVRSGKLDSSLTRRMITDVQLQVRGLKANAALSQDLPPGTRMTLELAQLRYETKHIHHALLTSGRLSENLIDKDGVTISSPMAPAELRNPRNEDRERANALITHLHDNMEYYHRTIWLSMDPSRRFMLLDGIVAPNANGRSVASVVENRLIGIAGNSMVLPVVPGMKLDPVYQQGADPNVSLLDAYMPEEPTPPLLVAVPTRGVYAESVMGSCNSCEKKDETRFWRWEESPLPDQPAPIGLLSTDSRGTPAPDLTAKDFAAPIINLQNAPAAPDPTGLAAMLGLIGKGDSFRDLSGLNQNQLNAAAALGAGVKATSDASQLALQKSMMSNVGQLEEQVQRAVDRGTLTKEDGQQIMKSAFEKAVGAQVGVSERDRINKPTHPQNVSQFSEQAAKDGVRVTIQEQEFAGYSFLDIQPTILAVPVVLLGNDHDARAFFPSTGDKSGLTTLEVKVSSGDKVKWKIADPVIGKGHFGEFKFVGLDDEPKVTLSAVKPGKRYLTCTVTSSAGKSESKTFAISVPAYAMVERGADFNTFLTEFPEPTAAFGLDLAEDVLLFSCKGTVESIFTPDSVNIRVLWKHLDEKPPKDLKPDSLIRVTIRNSEATLKSQGLLALSSPKGERGQIFLNPSVDIYAGNFFNPMLNNDLQSNLTFLRDAVTTLGVGEPLELELADVVGRFLGENIAHELCHILFDAFDKDFPGQSTVGGHIKFEKGSEPKCELMWDGPFRSFAQRTGVKIPKTWPKEPLELDPSSFSRMSEETLPKVGSKNLADRYFPIEPSF